ncbi:MAG: hypothetical protein H6873_03205 [Hyphomicrobiaceae bacterium]|nr:hypothetical protein [Hyphomicrobiaceae bacterium]
MLRLVGVAFIVSAVVNFFGLGEDIAEIFARMAGANQGTRLAGVSALIAGHERLAIVIAATFMFATGLAELLVRRFASLAAIGQVVLMLVFVTLLHRAYPEVILTDGLLMLAIALGLSAPHREMVR